MSLLKDFTELHVGHKTIILSVAILMPFWYTSLYLFSNLPIDSNYQIPVVISFCLSLCWWGLHWVGAMMFLSFFDSHNSKPEKEKNSDISELAAIASIGYISLLMFIVYLFDISFHVLVYISFSFTLARWVGYIIIVIVRPEKPKSR